MYSVLDGLLCCCLCVLYCGRFARAAARSRQLAGRRALTTRGGRAAAQRGERAVAQSELLSQSLHCYSLCMLLLCLLFVCCVGLPSHSLLLSVFVLVLFSHVCCVPFCLFV